jgi:hypothetical protein
MRLRIEAWCPSFVVALSLAACGTSGSLSDGTAGSAGAIAAAGATSSGAGSGGADAASGGSSGSAAVGGSSQAGSSAAGAAGSGASGAASAGAGGAANAGGAGGSGGGSAGAGGAPSKTTFFVTSDKSMTANLGGLKGADARCQALAVAAGLGDHTFHAYLSVEHEPPTTGMPLNAKDRIGAGPWYNSKGVLLAQNVAALHALPGGNPELFLDEKGQKINGQWTGLPTPLEHDILTGSTATGTVLAGQTCADWTSVSTMQTAQVGHADGLGPGMSMVPPYNSWNSAHTNGSCADTGPKGGAGRLYCFATN